MFEYLEYKTLVFGGGSNVDVKIWTTGDNVLYTKRLWAPANINETGVSTISVKELSEKMDALGINKWKKQYQPEDCFVLDGEEWLIRYMDSTRQRKKVINGDNAYPDNWDEFLGVLTEVVGDIGVEDDNNKCC